MGDSCFSVHFGHAYALSDLLDAVRTFSCDDGGVIIKDRFLFSKEPVSLTERFIAVEKPVLSKGEVRVSDTILRYDENALEISVSSETYSAQSCKQETVYFIDLVPKCLAKEAEYVFHFEVLHGGNI